MKQRLSPTAQVCRDSRVSSPRQLEMWHVDEGCPIPTPLDFEPELVGSLPHGNGDGSEFLGLPANLSVDDWREIDRVAAQMSGTHGLRFSSLEVLALLLQSTDSLNNLEVRRSHLNRLANNPRKVWMYTGKFGFAGR
jgi:hypothetical protein